MVTPEEAPEGYEEQCHLAFAYVHLHLVAHPVSQGWDPVEMWERLGCRFPELAQVTWLMWSTAFDEARRCWDLAPSGPYPVALVGEMAEPAVRAAARKLLEGTAGGVPVPVIIGAIQRAIGGEFR